MPEVKAISTPLPLALRPLIGFSTARELGVPIAVLGIVVALITPLPPFLLDVLIVTDIMISVVVMMVSIYLTRPVDFSVFPTTLLLLTLFRLALNISSTRLILMHGHTGTSAAGEIIEAFGNFVVGGNYVIGTVIFLVLIAIQYVVINHGAVRISEVTARFTLDALPGKQMSIDSDLNAGLVDETEARNRRKMLTREAEFYGAMDGASRFTQRDAVASILITGINIIAGFLIGVLQHGMELGRALETYTVLTIGDGLVTVIPALMISVSGGLIVTRTSSEDKLGADFHKQVFSNSEPLLLAGGVLILLGAFPGLPTLPFVLMGGTIAVVAWRKRGREESRLEAEKQARPSPVRENLEALLHVEPLSIEIGLGLIKFVEGGKNSPLLRRIAAIRQQITVDLGYVLPPVRVTDNLSLRTCQYVVYLKNAEIARYELPQGCELAIPVGNQDPPAGGQQTREPAFGMTGWWVPRESAEAVRRAGFTVVDPVSVLGTHVSELIRKYVHEIFSRQDTKKLLDRIGLESPKLVEDLVPKLLPLVTVQRVLQNLLRERVSIRDAVSILEALGEAALNTRNPMLMTEYVRQAVRRSIVKPYLNTKGELPAFLVDPALERTIEAAIEHGEQNSHLSMSPEQIRDVAHRILRVTGTPDAPVVVVSSPGARYFLRQMMEAAAGNLFFISHNEVPAEVRVSSLGIIQ